MRAIRVDRPGSNEVLNLADWPVPTPGPTEVLVMVACAGVNFMDIATRIGRYETSSTYKVRLPCTLGMEGAGTVVAVGAQVTHRQVGDRVAWCIVWGSFADFAVVPEALAAKLPDGVGFEVAAAAMFQGCTAHYLVHDVGRVKAGDTILVHAAAGGIGQIVIQLARNRGARVIATASTPEKRDLARRRGADETVDYAGRDWVVDVLELTGGVGVDTVFDSVGRTTLRGSFRVTRPRGLVVNYGAVSGSVTDLDPLELGEAGSLMLTRPRLADHVVDAVMVQGRADDVFGAIARGELVVEVADRQGLDQLPDALDRLEKRRQVGKSIISIS